ncbi:MAG: transcription initiation protein [Microbacteriaceae bacterium]|nr:MAG: transcription initiation protein [Microbacteriaceae bacterium]
MTQYAALVYEEGDPDWGNLDTPDKQETMSDYGAFGATAAAVLRGGAALYPTSSATTVRVRGGKGGEVVASDGPFAETTEVLTGFYLMECVDLDEAIRWAAQIPAAWTGKVEVRPVIDFDA